MKDGAMKKSDRSAVAIATGARIRRLRESKGFIRDEFGPMVGVSSRVIGNYETGKNLLPAETAIRIAELFGATLDWIYWGHAGGLPPKLLAELEGSTRRR